MNTDYISRQAVIDLMMQKWGENFSGDDAMQESIDAIRVMPSVTQLSSELEKNSKKLEKNFGELDCISREQALKALKESAEHHANDSREEVLLRRDRDIIRALPSIILQEPKTGHWIAQDIHNCHTEFKCSECGYIHSFMHLYGKPTADYTYCPNCGSDNREASVKIVNRGKCMLCGKELTEGLFFCKECAAKAETEGKE